MKRQTRIDRQKKSSVLMQKDAAYTKWLKNNNRNRGCNCLRSIDMTEVTNHIWLKRNRAGTGIYRGEFISMEYCVSVSLFDAPRSSRFTYSLWFALYFLKTVALFLFLLFLQLYSCVLLFVGVCIVVHAYGCFIALVEDFVYFFPFHSIWHATILSWQARSDCTLKRKANDKK